jgi:hypothetical protein
VAAPLIVAMPQPAVRAPAMSETFAIRAAAPIEQIERRPAQRKHTAVHSVRRTAGYCDTPFYFKGTKKIFKLRCL